MSLRFPDIFLTVEGKFRKKPQPGKLTRPGIEPRSATCVRGSPGELSEELVTQEKRKKGWRMNSDVGEATFPSLHLRHNRFSNPSVVLPKSHLILQPFRCFTYVTAHSPTVIWLLLRHKLFTYVTWRAAHGKFTSCTFGRTSTLCVRVSMLQLQQ